MTGHSKESRVKIVELRDKVVDSWVPCFFRSTSGPVSGIDVPLTRVIVRPRYRSTSCAPLKRCSSQLRSEDRTYVVNDQDDHFVVPFVFVLSTSSLHLWSKRIDRLVYRTTVPLSAILS